MKFENKANLIFLVVLVLALIPGGYKLFVKKLDPSQPAMYLPEPVARSIAYVAPLPAPPGSVARVVPPRTAAWVASLVRANSGAERVEMAGPASDPQPLVGDRWGFQVASVEPAPGDGADVNGAGGVRVGMVVWDKRAYAGVDWFTFTAEFPGGATATAKPDAVRAVVLPMPVRRELQEFGFIDPPEQVLWVPVTFRRPPAAPADVAPADVAPADAAPVGYAMRYEDSDSDFADRLAVAAPTADRPAETPVAENVARR